MEPVIPTCTVAPIPPSRAHNRTRYMEVYAVTPYQYPPYPNKGARKTLFMSLDQVCYASQGSLPYSSLITLLNNFYILKFYGHIKGMKNRAHD